MANLYNVGKSLTDLGSLTLQYGQLKQENELRTQQLASAKQQMNLAQTNNSLSQLNNLTQLYESDPAYAKKYAQLPQVKKIITTGLGTNDASGNLIPLDEKNYGELVDSLTTNTARLGWQNLYGIARGVVDGTVDLAKLPPGIGDAINARDFTKIMTLVPQLAEIDLKKAEAQSGIGNKFVFGQQQKGVDTIIGAASNKLKSYREIYDRLLNAESGLPQEQLQAQALRQSGIGNASQLDFLQRLENADPFELTKARAKGLSLRDAVYSMGGSEELDDALAGMADEKPASGKKADAVPVSAVQDVPTKPQKTPSASDIKDLSEAESIPVQLNELTTDISNYKDLFGPISGRARAANPYDARAQVFQSKIKALAQTYGKFKEGGVLRKEDVPKYEAIFPKFSDTYDVAVGKLANVLKDTETTLQIRKEMLESAQFKVPESQTAGKKPAEPSEKEVVKKGYNANTDQTWLLYNDGTEEVVSGKQ